MAPLRTGGQEEERGEGQDDDGVGGEDAAEPIAVAGEGGQPPRDEPASELPPLEAQRRAA